MVGFPNSNLDINLGNAWIFSLSSLRSIKLAFGSNFNYLGLDKCFINYIIMLHIRFFVTIEREYTVERRLSERRSTERPFIRTVVTRGLTLPPPPGRLARHTGAMLAPPALQLLCTCRDLFTCYCTRMSLPSNR